MSLLDLLTGGQTSQAQTDLEAAQAAFANVQTPTAAQLTLPQLQQYVQAGLMTPAQAQAALQGPSAMNAVQADPATTEAEMTALGQLQQVAGDSGMTPQMQAQLTAALNQANTNTQGERGSIQDSMAQRGISNSLMGTAAQEAAAGQDAQTANLAGTQAAGQAEQNALTAMANSGALAGNINAQEFGQGAQKAAAQNAINQWNTQQQQQVNLANQANTQASNLYNTQTAQNVSGQNTGLANEQTQYNAQVPETVFQNQIQKAGGQAGVSEAQANQATAAGQQQAGLIGGILGGSSQIGAAAAAPTPVIAAAAKGGTVEEGGFEDPVPGPSEAPDIYKGSDGRIHTGKTYIADDGGNVPGTPVVDGDSRRNDRVHALLSPGEVVVPRTIAHDPNRVKNFVASLMRQPKPIKPIHPDDLHGLMEAMSRRREANAIS